jgi:diguanylate cyclase (GGDEF)-like protein/PAS domain S-box-containing protein
MTSPLSSGPRPGPDLRLLPGSLTTRSSPAVTGLVQLARTVHERPSDSDTLVVNILKLLAESLLVAQVHVTRIDGGILRYERVYDQGGMNVHEGDAISLDESYCQVMLEMAASSLVVEDARADERFASLASTGDAGIGSYSGVPLYQNDGRLYGTLCALHPNARSVGPDEPALLALAGQIVMQTIEANTARQELFQLTEAAARALQTTAERYRAVVESSADAIVVTDLIGCVVLGNAQAADMFGFSAAAALIGVNVVEYIATNDRERAIDIWKSRRTLTKPQNRDTEYSLLRRDGSTFPAEIGSSVLLSDHGDPMGLTVVIRDISERKSYERQLQHQALHDALTDLPNRTLFQQRLQQLIESARREDSACAVLLLDLDGFKELNDTFGHRLGDQVLQHLASRLTATSRHSDTIARLGGDEFALLIPRTGADEARQVAEKLLAVVRRPLPVDGQVLAIDGSIGIALYPDHGADAATLLRRVDMAMYAAKRGHTTCMLYDHAQDGEGKRRLIVSQGLRSAMGTDQFFLHFQPKVDLAGRAVAGVEALLRWRHPELGMISPDEFIPLAEQGGLMTLMTRWILDEALTQCRLWYDRGLDLHVAVNLSARSLHDHHLVDVVAAALNRSGTPPSRLVLEITESQIMADPDHALTTLRQLRGLGATVAIDDFGTGYSSLSYLGMLPAQELKIDRSFVMDMEYNADHRRIVEATISLAHDLRLHTVAEGVETQQTLDLLTGLGCDMAQGYQISRPLPGREVADWVQSHGTVIGRRRTTNHAISRAAS